MKEFLSERISIKGKNLKTKMTIIAALLFVQPFFVVSYIFYREDLFSKTEYLYLIFFVMLLVLGGMLILRDTFDKFVMVASFMKKAEAGEIAMVEVEKDTAELRDISRSFNIIMTKLSDTTGQLERQTAELTGALSDRDRFQVALRESEERFRIAAECASDLAYEWDLPANRVIYFGRFKEKLSFRPEDLPKTAEEWENMIHPDEREQISFSLKRFLETGKPFSEEYQFAKKDGTYLFVAHRAVVLHDKEGAARRVIGALTDMTEHRQAENKIKKLNKELELKVEKSTKELLEAQEELVRRERLSLLGQLAGSVGHELRNPLGVMNNAIYFLKNVVHADEGVKEYLNIIKNEIDNSERIIADLLDFSRVKVPQMQPVAVNEIITQCMGRYAIPKDVAVDVDIPEGLPLVMADPFQMGQVFQNLFTNAFQAMPEGGSLHISARPISGLSGNPDSSAPRSPNPEIEIAVADTGEGISPENISKLFQPLFTTKAKGIGLGLTVCKELTEANGGRIEVESALGKGSAFRVILQAEDRRVS